jgi:endonuclease/exonuclease/phosphatase family metal-dependent hydrolase
VSYRDENPRFAGDHAVGAPDARGGAVLDVVTLNIRFARRIDLAKRLFARVGELARANVVLLQEMDVEGTEALAAALRMRWVYYPAAVHRATGRDFGNAVLSRWPILRDDKINLPHLSLRDRSPRAATCATIDTPIGPIELCSVHVATPFELLPGARREQVRAVLSRLRGASRVVVGGDFNSRALGRIVAADALDWATKDVGSTLRFFAVDHIFARGLRASEVGKVTDTLGATDHAAVWSRFLAR